MINAKENEFTLAILAIRTIYKAGCIYGTVKHILNSSLANSYAPPAGQRARIGFSAENHLIHRKCRTR